MPARLLAYGGTSFSERRRIGHWPTIPEATLRDTYGLSANTWCFGFGIVDKQPFLIFRQRQNVENRGGYPFSLLLDPGDTVWSRFDWNPASIADVLMRETPDALFRNPENCSVDTLEKQMAALSQPTFSSTARGSLAYAVVSAALATEPVSCPQRPQAAELASALAAVPICFRAGTGWLVGGALAHGRTLGAALVFDGQGSSDATLGHSILNAWESVTTYEIVRQHETQPAFLWPEQPADFLKAIMLLRDITTTDAVTDDLLLRVEQSNALHSEIDQALQNLLEGGTGPLGPRASVMLIRPALQGHRSIAQLLAARLDPATLAAELRKYGSPPKHIPATLPVSRELHLNLWTQYLESLKSEIARNLEIALDQLGPAPELVASALTALPGSDDDLLHWRKFENLEEPLRNEALRRFRRGDKNAAAAYLLLGADPGGSHVNEALPRDDDAIRLVTEIRALENDYPAEANAWLAALKKSPLRKRIPKTTKVQPPVLTDDLRHVLFESDPDNVDERCNQLPRPEARVALDEYLPAAATFAKAFYGKYGSLGCVMSFLTDESQERLLACFESDLSGFAAEHVKHALNNKPSRSHYTAALARYLQKNPRMLRHIAGQLGYLPSEFEPKLRTLAKDKGRT